MTSRVHWYEPRQEQINPRNQETNAGEARGYDKEIRKKVDHLNSFIEESSALFMNDLPVTPGEQTDAKIAIIETMLAKIDQHDATCNDMIMHVTCECYEDENHIITRRNLKLLKEIHLAIKKHLVSKPPNVQVKRNTYFDEANDID